MSGSTAAQRIAPQQVNPTPVRRAFSQEAIRYFEDITADRDQWERQMKSFLKHTLSFLRTTIRPGSRVIIFGCPSWQLLDALQPSYGIGVHLSHHLVTWLNKECTNPRLEFYSVPPERFSSHGKFDYVVLLHQSECSADLFALLESIRHLVDHESVLIVSRTNPVWQPFVRVASFFRIRIPDFPRSFFSDDVIHSSLEAKGFRIRGEYNRQIFPRHVPWLSHIVNTYLGRLPFIHRLGFIKYTVAKLSQTTPDTDLTCSVIIPCFNEEGNIRECVSRVPFMGRATEILVVDDGSTDRTAQIARELETEQNNVRCVVSAKNQGKGKAVTKGIEVATGDVIFILDADMTVPPEELSDFFDAIAYGAGDFVSGTRFVYPMEDRAMRLPNYLGNIFFSRLVQVIVGTVCTDTLCGTKVMRRKDFLDMKLEDSSWGDFDFIFHAAKRKLKSIQIPVHYKSRTSGKSKMKAFTAGMRFLRCCFRAWGAIP